MRPARGPRSTPPAGKPRDKKRDKKHAGPPRERPPVNRGDIVFGKIIEITDEAILIDIPGKAKAIFDRRELLLPTRTTSSRRRRRRGGGRRRRPPARGSAGRGARGSGPRRADRRRAPAEAPAPAAGARRRAEAASARARAHAPSPRARPRPRPNRARSRPTEPKVPRVVLEVGADFIAVVHNDGARGGLVVLTHHPRRAERAQAAVEKAFNEKTLIDGLVTGVIKGGIEVDVDGLRAFAPGSHVDLHLGADLSYLVGKRLPFLVTQYAKRGRDLVLSRKLDDRGRGQEGPRRGAR